MPVKDPACFSNDKQFRPGSTFQGSRIRDLRKAQKLSLHQLAAASDLTAGYLSQAERNLRTPSIDALHRISRALDARISWFFVQDSPTSKEDEGIVVRRHSRWIIDWSPEMQDEVLSPTLSRDIQLLKSHFKPGAEVEDSYKHEGEKAGLVLEGMLELWVGSRHFLLTEGDSFAFESMNPHRYRNPGETDAVVIWVMKPPRL